MRVGVPVWRGRISPVFDVARRLIVAEIDGPGEVARQEMPLEETQLGVRVRRLVDGGVGILICGAISGPLEQMLVSAGVRVIPQTCGAVEDVLQAFLSGQLTEQAFLLPGCCRRHRRRRAGRCGGRLETSEQGDSE